MTKRTEVNINCPICGNPIVTIYKEQDIRGVLQHKCSKCKRHWDVDYTSKCIEWVKGKENYTPIKEFQLAL